MYQRNGVPTELSCRLMCSAAGGQEGSCTVRRLASKDCRNSILLEFSYEAVQCMVWNSRPWLQIFRFMPLRISDPHNPNANVVVQKTSLCQGAMSTRQPQPANEIMLGFSIRGSGANCGCDCPWHTLRYSSLLSCPRRASSHDP